MKIVFVLLTVYSSWWGIEMTLMIRGIDCVTLNARISLFASFAQVSSRSCISVVDRLDA